MAEETGSGTGEKKQIGGELVIPVAALIFTLYYFSTIYNSPWTAQVSAFFIGAILLLLIAIFMVKSAIAWKAGEVGLSLDTLVSPHSFITKRLALLALTVGFIFFVQWAGFTITTFIFLGLAMLLLSGTRRWRLILFLSATLAIGGYLLFILAFDTRFPEGPFEQLMEPLKAMVGG
jgi:hypothetical protein